MQLTDIVSLYVAAHLAGCPDNTIAKHWLAVEHFRSFLGHDPTLEDFTDPPVRAYGQWLIRKRGLSIDTASCYHSRLLAQWRFACRQGLLTIWPEQQKLKCPKRIPIAWTREELRRLWAACESQTGLIAGVPAGLWWNSLHSVGWDTAERITALRSARWVDVRLPDGWLTIRAEHRKGQTEDKIWQLHPTTVALLLQFPTRRGLVWPWEHHPTCVWRLYNQLLESAGLPTDRKHKFHCLRKSVASYFEAAGGDSTRLLGHSSRDVTVASYLDPTITRPVQASDLLFRPAG